MMQLCHRITCCFWALVAFPLLAFSEDANDRNEKLISTFQIVRFPNDVCIGSNSRNGTCYTSAECSDKSGTSSGSCADGFGVCCTFVITACGSTSSENNTYWTQPSAGITRGTDYTCGLTVCPVSDDICTLRLDFTTFIISGPNTLSIKTRRSKFGHPSADLTDTDGALQGNGMTTNCQYDTFTAQGASASSNPPEVCGVLTASHMYVEADVDRCNLLQFTFGDYVSTAATVLRGITALVTGTWDITVSQIECSSPTNPPAGCTKFFWGSGKYVLTNYNYRGDAAVTGNLGIHLANQHERMCIRREKGNCIGCFATDAEGFAVSGSSEEAANYVNVAGCCGYLDIPSGGHLASAEDAGFFQGSGMNEAGETDGAYGTTGFDCIVIPGAYVPATDEGEVGVSATTAADTGVPVAAQSATVLSTYNTEDNYMTPSGPQICGQGAGIGIGAASVSIAAAGTANVGVGGVLSASATSLTICSRADPFILEFLSDDIDGQGGETTENGSEINSATQIANLGFSITHTQVEC
jgi:hypothetical protein